MISRINKLLTLSLAIIFFVNCSDLDRFPYNQLSQGTFWTTDEHAKKGILGVYAKLKTSTPNFGGGNYAMLFASDCMSDIGMGYDEPGHYRMQTGNYTGY